MNWDILVIDPKRYHINPSSEERKVIGHNVVRRWVKALPDLSTFFLFYMVKTKTKYD